MLEVVRQCHAVYSLTTLRCRILQLIITVVFQYFIMRDLEKLAGSLRIGVIYIASGIGGSLSSAIFLPYHVEVCLLILLTPMDVLCTGGSHPLVMPYCRLEDLLCFLLYVCVYWVFLLSVYCMFLQ